MSEHNRHEEGCGCKKPNPARRVLPGFMARLFGWWAGASGLFAMLNATCPFCGRPGCLTGAGASGLLGAFVALAAADWKKLVSSLKRRARSNRAG